MGVGNQVDPAPVVRPAGGVRGFLFSVIKPAVEAALRGFDSKVARLESRLDAVEAADRWIRPEGLEELASRTGEPWPLALERAINLYRIAVDERERGNRLAVLNPDDEIVRDIEGILPADDPQPSPAGAAG